MNKRRVTTYGMFMRALQKRKDWLNYGRMMQAVRLDKGIVRFFNDPAYIKYRVGTYEGSCDGLYTMIGHILWNPASKALNGKRLGDYQDECGQPSKAIIILCDVQLRTRKGRY